MLIRFFFEELYRLNEGYSGLRGKKQQGSDEGVGENDEESFSEFWGWQLVLDNLSNHDRTKWDFFLNMDVVEFLNTVSFYKDKQKWEHEIQKQQMRNANR